MKKEKIKFGQDWTPAEEKKPVRALECHPGQSQVLWIIIMLLIIAAGVGTASYVWNQHLILSDEMDSTQIQDNGHFWNQYFRGVRERMQNLKQTPPPQPTTKPLMLGTVDLNYALQYPVNYQIVDKVDQAKKENTLEFYDGPMIYDEGGPFPVVTVIDMTSKKTVDAFVKTLVGKDDQVDDVTLGTIAAKKITYANTQSNPWYAAVESYVFTYTGTDNASHLVQIDAARGYAAAADAMANTLMVKTMTAQPLMPAPGSNAPMIPSQPTTPTPTQP